MRGPAVVSSNISVIREKRLMGQCLPCFPNDALQIGAPKTSQGSRSSQNLDCRTFLREKSGSALDYYKKIGDLGEGAYGDVWLARQRVCAGTPKEHLGRLVAVKRVRKPNPNAGLDEDGADSQKALEEMHIEVELMKSLDHPSICRLFQVHEDAKNLYLVMEHMQGQELFERISELGSFEEGQASDVIQQISSCLVYCHRQGVVHRDIKPENVMVLDPEDEDEARSSVRQVHDLTIKLIDFGFGCRILHGVKLKAKVGSLVYTAPEVLQGDPCDEKQDLWSLGCLLHVLLAGQLPFYGSGKSVLNQIEAGEFLRFNEPVWAEVSSGAKRLIGALLTINPDKRLDAAGVLTHPWMVHLRHEGSAAPLKQINALKAFQKQSLFHKVCSGVMARQLDEKLLVGLHESFCAMDENADGMVSIEEFKKACQVLGPECDEIFSSLDMDGNGCLDYTEFIAACIDHKIESQESVCWAAFQVFDKDGSGTVSVEELREVLNHASMQATFPSADMAQIYEELGGAVVQEEDLGDARSIDFDHFLAALRRNWSPESSCRGSTQGPSRLSSLAVDSQGTDAWASSMGTGAWAQTSSRQSSGSDKPQLPTAASGMLPIQGRGGGIAAGMLPIPGRATAPMGLPIQSRAVCSPDPPSRVMGLPISSRADPGSPDSATGSQALPMQSRGVVGLPIPARNLSAAVAMGLPVQSRVAAMGLPIKSRSAS